MNHTPQRGELRLAHLVTALLFLFAVAWVIDRLDGFRPLVRNIRSRTIETSAFGSGDTVKILRKLRLIHPVPYEFTPSYGAVYRSTKHTVQRSNLITESFYSLDDISSEQIPGALRIDPQWLAKPVSIVSLLMRPADLALIKKRSRGRGRKWEKEGFFSYLENGALLFSSRVGVRLHGGWTRDKPQLASYRIYFRNSYGFDGFTPAIFPGRRGAPRQLVIRKDVAYSDSDFEARFRSPLAYDIARRIGCPAPETRPVAFFLNGELMGIKALTEYIHLDYLKAYYGHDHFVLARTKTGRYSPGPKVKEGDPLLYREFRKWIRKAPAMSMKIAAKKVDLDNLSRWFLSVLFCATEDTFQGALVLDERAADARWFWIAWDMDMSFETTPYRNSRPKDYFDLILNSDDSRSIILKRLMSESPEYRTYLAQLFVEVMNHRLTEQFLNSRIDQYRSYAISYWVSGKIAKSSKAIADFIKHRHSALRGQMGSHLGAGESYQVQIRATQDRLLEIDSYSRASPYSGWYFQGMHVVVKVPEGDSRFSHWVVNGEPVVESGRELLHKVLSDVTIEAVFLED